MSAVAMAYRVSLSARASHMLVVDLSIDGEGGALPEHLDLFMPVWTPGSYLVREYARHVEGLTVAPPASVTKVRKNGWQVRTAGSARTHVRYRVYAGQMSVRTSHVDESHAFVVGAATFLGVNDQPVSRWTLTLEIPTGWRVSTPLREIAGGSETERTFGAPTFDVLVDAPIEVGTHREEPFEALGTTHRLAVCPADAASDADVRRLIADARVIARQVGAFFGGQTPYSTYLALLHLRPSGKGGLEHRESMTVIAPRSSFATRTGYLELLSLLSHELLHAYSGTRIRPAGLVPYRYEEECYTRLLWWFEGGTSYYDWRSLVLSGLCTVEEYLDHLASEIAYLEQTPGRLVASLEEASFDAWIKLYRPDENSANSSVSYYRKGEVVCAMLDLELRSRTGGRASLDSIAAHLWTEYGARGSSVPEDGMQEIFERVSGTPLGDLFDGWIRGTAEVDCAAVLARFGLSLEHTPRPDGVGATLGARWRIDGGRVWLASTSRDSSAAKAGLHVGDEILAIHGARVDAANVEGPLRGLRPGQAVEVALSREGRLLTRTAQLDAPAPERVKLVAKPEAPEAARAALRAWLGGSHPAWAQESRAAQ